MDDPCHYALSFFPQSVKFAQLSFLSKTLFTTLRLCNCFCFWRPPYHLKQTRNSLVFALCRISWTGCTLRPDSKWIILLPHACCNDAVIDLKWIFLDKWPKFAYVNRSFLKIRIRILQCDSKGEWSAWLGCTALAFIGCSTSHWSYTWQATVGMLDLPYLVVWYWNVPGLSVAVSAPDQHTSLIGYLTVYTLRKVFQLNWTL